MKTYGNFHLPTLEQCEEICRVNPGFYSISGEVEGYAYIMFNYFLAERRDFEIPIPGKTFDAFEMRGLMFIANKPFTPLDKGYTAWPALRKFFNLDQCAGWRTYDLYHAGNPDVVNIREKLDGSMIGIVRLPNGKLLTRTKSTFESIQAKRAMALIQRIPEKNLHKLLDDGFLPVYELTAPWNRVVVRYPMTWLRLIALRDRETLGYADLNDQDIAKMGIGCEPTASWPGEYTAFDLGRCMEDIKSETGMEGYVALLEDGKMIKLKTKWYCDLHGIVTDKFHREDFVIDAIISEKIIEIIEQLNDYPVAQDVMRNFINVFKVRVYEYTFEFIEALIKTMDSYNDQTKAIQEFFAKDDIEHCFIMGMFQKAILRYFKSRDKASLEDNVKKQMLKETYKLENARRFLKLYGVDMQEIIFPELGSEEFKCTQW